jgi:hypothetical protein
MNVFNPPRFFRYATRPIPCEQDEEVLTTLASGELNAAAFSRSDAQVLNALAMRMAVRAVREQDPKWIGVGLRAFAWAITGTSDERDVLPSAALLWNSAVLLGEDPREAFLAAAGSLGTVGDEIRRFAHRRPEDQTLDSMGFAAEVGPDGFTYRRRW